MKQSGLRNRFPQSVRLVWLYWYDCMYCGMNQIDTLHHMISPSVRHYVDGNHNESVFNSCPIHNMKHPNAGGEVENCHIGNEAYLYSDDGLKYLLNKVARALLWDLEYSPNEKDKTFLRTYRHLYENDIIKRSNL